MCLYSPTDLKKAYRPIKCYKVLYKDLTSPYYNHQYQIGVEESSKLRKCHNAIQEGLYSYTDLKQAKLALRRHYNRTEKNYRLFECTVPAGSLYYMGNSECLLFNGNTQFEDAIFDTIASNKLIINREINVKLK